MAYGKGKSFLIKRETTPGVYVTVGGMKATAMQLNNQLIDVTDKDLPDWIQKMGGNIKSLSFTLSGVMKDNAQLLAILAAASALDGTDIQNFQLVSSLGYKFQGAFGIEDFSANGDVGKEESYSVKLNSAGNITYTAPT